MLTQWRTSLPECANLALANLRTNAKIALAPSNRRHRGKTYCPHLGPTPSPRLGSAILHLFAKKDIG